MKMNIALIGYGYWGKILESYIIKNDLYNLKKIYDPFFQKKDGIKTNNLEDILSDENIESVLIATPISTHFEISKLCLERGKNIFCEKPLELDSQRVKELMEISEKRNLKLETNYIYTDSKSIIKLKELIPKLGKISLVKGSILQYGKFYKGADVYSVLGCHLVSTIHFLFDKKINITRVNNLLNDYNGNVSYGIIEGDVKGIQLNLEASLSSIGKKREINIYGDNGVAKFDMLGDKTLEIKIFKSLQTEECEVAYSYDEANNIERSLKRFYLVVKNKQHSNINLSMNTTKVLGEINEKSK